MVLRVRHIFVACIISTACGFLGLVTEAPGATWTSTLSRFLWNGSGAVEDPSGGYIFSGESRSGAGVLMKLDADGRLSWQRAYRSSERIVGSSIHPSPDYGFVLSFRTFSERDLHYHSQIARLDSEGNVIWNREILGPGNSIARVLPTRDGGFVASGIGRGDGLIAKLSSSGELVWLRRYGGEQHEEISDLIETDDGGYLFAGAIDVPETSTMDGWIVKLDGRGRILWQKAYGGQGYDRFTGIRQAGYDHYVAVGYTYSSSMPGSAAWVVNIDSSGEPVWQRAYGGTNVNTLASVVVDPDGSIVSGGGRQRPNGGSAAWIMKLDGSGDVIWENTYDELWFRRIARTSDGGYVASGDVEADITRNAPKIVKIGNDGRGGTCVGLTPSTSTVDPAGLPIRVLAAESWVTSNYAVSRPLEVAPADYTVSTCLSKSVQVTSPNGGGIIPSGDTRRLSWKTFGETSSVDLALVCRDREEAIAEGLAGGFYDYTFPVPSDNLRICRIRATARDAAGAVLDVDASDGHFPVEVVRLLSPDEGQALHSGDICPVTWLVNATSAPVARADFYLSLNAGRTWDLVGSSRRHERGSFVVPEVDMPRARCLLRIELLDEKETMIGHDPSHGYFVINP